MFAGIASAQNTSSSIRIVVTEPGGAAVSGVSVSVIHVPTGRTRVSSTNSDGVATTRGLAVGGPYEVAVVGGGNYAADVQQNIFVDLDKTEVIEIQLHDRFSKKWWSQLKR